MKWIRVISWENCWIHEFITVHFIRSLSHVTMPDVSIYASEKWRYLVCMCQGLKNQKTKNKTKTKQNKTKQPTHTRKRMHVHMYETIRDPVGIPTPRAIHDNIDAFLLFFFFVISVSSRIWKIFFWRYIELTRSIYKSHFHKKVINNYHK